MENAPQLLVPGWVVRAVRCPVVLAEELDALSFREVSEDYQRIGRIFRRLCGHATQPMPASSLACLPHRPINKTNQTSGIQLRRCGTAALPARARGRHLARQAGRDMTGGRGIDLVCRSRRPERPSGDRPDRAGRTSRRGGC
jgi:hypothetical protein